MTSSRIHERRVSGALRAAAALLLFCLISACGSLPARRSPTEAPPVSAIPASTTTELGRVAAAFQDNDGLSGARAMPDSPIALDARIALIRNAQASLDVQYYELGDDKTGKLILRELRDAAARGVRVRLLLDDYYLAGLDPMLLGLAAQPNVELRLFNPFVFGRDQAATRWVGFAFDFRRLNHRMHNKLLVADGAFAIAGGRNLADAYFLRSADANFVDLDVLLVGPVVNELAGIFDVYWNSDVVYPLQSVAPSTATPEARRATFSALTDTRLAPTPEVPPADRFGAPPVSAVLPSHRMAWTKIRANALADAPSKAQDLAAGQRAPELRERLIARMDEARSEIIVVSPYFIPGPDGLAYIERLRARGVRITVITNSLADTDEPLVNVDYDNYRVAMLKLGVQVFEVSSTELHRDSRTRPLVGAGRERLHAKLVVIDRKTVFMGSLNFDPRSAHLNTEVGVRLQSPELAAQLVDAFQLDNIRGTYRVRLAPGTDAIQWVSTDGDDQVLNDEPDSSLLARLKLHFFSWFVPAALL
jgi:phosphatidylserine/phosphatidylglycerophosphate/cardiolipin synthase-like enzyme